MMPTNALPNRRERTPGLGPRPTDQTHDASETRSPAATSHAATRIAAPRAATAGSADLFMQSASLAFLASVLAVPSGCGFVAGTMYGHPRDGP